MGTSVAPSHPRSAEGPRIGRSYAAILLEAAVTPLNLVLFSVGAALVALGLTIDAAVTAIPVILNIAVQAGLEASAKHRLDQLRILFAPGALVLRAGREERVDVGMLEIGDVIVLGRGDQVVLDGAVVDGEIEIDESLLTGESDPAVRRAGDALLSGSVCVSGRATMRVTRAGDDSYASRLTLQARQDRAERTPLQHDIDRLIALAAGLVVAVSVAVVIAAGGRPPETSGAVQAAAVLVALVPQGLAIMITVSYAMGAVRISRAGALVQRINAVEAMSRVDTLVLDKTGTITSPRFEVRDVAWASPPDAAAWRLVRAIVASQPADDRVGGAIGRWLAAQEPATTDATEARSLTVSDVVAFSSVRRWSGIVVTESDGQIAQVGLLGAPEVLLVSDRDRQLAAVADRWMDRGDRIVVVSRADADSIFGADREPRLPQGHVPLLVLAFAEALRDDAASTLRAIEDAGIAIRIVSGDAPRSASAVAAAVGLAGADRPAASGPELDALSDVGLEARLLETCVVGRVDPGTKARIVTALRSRGRDVAMIGDGVNDILAIKAAQVGIAMESGSRASRTVADLVLLGDRFAVVPEAIDQGRRIVDGMLGAASLLMSRTLYVLLIILGATLAGLAFPFTPRNNSLLALVTVGLPSLVIVGWARPVPPSSSALRTVLRFAIPAAIAVTVVSLPVYAAYLAAGAPLELARSALVTITVDCGLLLIPALARTSAVGGADDAAGSTGRGAAFKPDARPTVLAISLACVYGLLAALPTARWFFELAPLPATDLVALGLLALAWAFALSLLRRAGIDIARARRIPQSTGSDDDGSPRAAGG